MKPISLNPPKNVKPAGQTQNFSKNRSHAYFICRKKIM